MQRRAIAFLCVAGLGATCFWPQQAESPHAPPADARPVVVEHRFVTVPEPASAPPAVARPVRRAAVRSRPRREPGTLLGRAARAVLGDGRHRPEPFPRPRGSR
jgi:hypothetical protein